MITALPIPAALNRKLIAEAKAASARLAQTVKAGQQLSLPQCSSLRSKAKRV